MHNVLAVLAAFYFAAEVLFGQAGQLIGIAGKEFLRRLGITFAQALEQLGSYLGSLHSQSINWGYKDRLRTVGDIVPVACGRCHTINHFGEGDSGQSDGSYLGLDAQRIARVAVGLDPGFLQWVLADPLIVGDVSGDNVLTGLDALQIAREAVGITQGNVPVLPAVTTGIAGPDPVVSIPTDLSAKPQAANAKPQAANAKPQAANAKPQAANAKPQAANAKPQAGVVVPVSMDHADGLSAFAGK